MIESIATTGGIIAALGLGAGVWYKLGKVEEKVDLIYEHLDICVKWINDNHKKKE